MTEPGLQEILREYRAGLAAALGDELDSVLLYGSQARGDAGEGSDIDVLCLMRGPFDYGDAIQKTSELTARISLDHDTLISRVFATRAEYEKSRMPFYLNVRKEAVPA